jgi:hypothetical protein
MIVYIMFFSLNYLKLPSVIFEFFKKRATWAQAPFEVFVLQSQYLQNTTFVPKYKA